MLPMHGIEVSPNGAPPRPGARAINCAWSQVSVVIVWWERFEIAKNRHRHHRRVIKREVRLAGLPAAAIAGAEGRTSAVSIPLPHRSNDRSRSVTRLFVRSFVRSGVSIRPRDFVMPFSFSPSLLHGPILPSHVPYRGAKIAVPCWAQAASLSPRNSPADKRRDGDATVMSSKKTLCVRCAPFQKLPASPPS